MSYFKNYKELDIEIEEVKLIIENQAKSRDKNIEEVLKDVLTNEGKMIRPALVILSAKFGKYNENIIRNLAAAVELLHMASLVHDDIVDDSKLRRNKETVQSKYGKDYAVYTGDFLLAKCFSLIAKSKKYSVIDYNTNAVSNVLTSELEQLNSRYETNISVLSYLRRIKGKTAELFITSMLVGSSQSGQKKKRISIMKRIGYNLGMAFQIKDDLLDFTGDDKSLGKSASNDIKLGLYTLPVLYALQEEKINEKTELLDILNKELTENSIERVKILINEYGGVEKSRDLLNKFTNKAVNQIMKLPKNESRETLMEMAKNLEMRSF